ncbi:hypothetical protein Cme02nite_33440 [Catellatospora methionotrophica]|uniref:Uncharacterized protein n=1 Tax=Catellatospora methionotrophica TaxID=121620 RepID=A0A8J3L5Y5_9ACTN|nr:hypothetical protein [Catellatospora methionotrophica]GIG15012.1 hypothetical protein Cme02nite_33440 [Catellatospora methionotrophica]
MAETDAPPPPRNRRGTAAVVMAALSLVLSLLACGAAGYVVGKDGFDPLPLQSAPQPATGSQVEAVAHVTLPPGTVLLSAVYSNGLETRLSAKFRLPRAALAAFVTAAQFSAAPTPGLRAIDKQHDVGGGNLWDPETAKTVSGIEEETPTGDGTYRRVMFGLDDPDSVTVYLHASRN